MFSNPMKKRISILFVLSLSAASFAFLAFANNICAIARWWSAFASSGGDTAGMPNFVGGFLPWLDWSVVDYSSVTTLIPALGFTCMTIALGRMLAGRRMRAGDFPFFRGSDQLNVALGLFGTLWGIIVIGYFRLDTVSMANLMHCLHTALFSTLMAVVWVFMVDRPLIRALFTRLLDKSGLAETDDGDLAQAVDRLVVRLGAASDAFDRRQREFEEASARRHAQFEADFERRLAAYQQEFDARQKEYVEFFRRRIDELERRAATAEGKLRKVAEAVI